MYIRHGVMRFHMKNVADLYIYAHSPISMSRYAGWDLGQSIILICNGNAGMPLY